MTTLSITPTFRDGLLDAGANSVCDAGKLRLYSGTPPATAATALSGNTLLAGLVMGTPAFGASSAGVLTANAVTSDASADATGTATFFRLYKADGTTSLMQGDVGTSAATCIIPTTSIVANAVVPCEGFTLTLAASS